MSLNSNNYGIFVLTSPLTHFTVLAASFTYVHVYAYLPVCVRMRKRKRKRKRKRIFKLMHETNEVGTQMKNTHTGRMQDTNMHTRLVKNTLRPFDHLKSERRARIKKLIKKITGKRIKLGKKSYS